MGEAKKVLAQMSIILFEGGEVKVNGPLTNKILSFGMLKCAEVAIENQGEKKIIVPDFMMPSAAQG